jgi:sulfatase modifying factor 1
VSRRHAGAAATAARVAIAVAALIAASGVGMIASACRKASRPLRDEAGPTPPSCADPPSEGAARCGPDGDSCCASPRVPGGRFARSDDGATNPSRSDIATVSPFRLDRYEVTVGRFRRFVGAVVTGYAPAAGSGKHAHLNEGRGLNAGTEPGWNVEWNAALARTAGRWNEVLACDRSATWTAEPSRDDARPINCVTWTEAYAFCVWDGGFLPSEAEWSDAASGGDEQRVYPWSRPPESTAFACAYVGREEGRGDGQRRCAAGTPGAVGFASPRSDARWGQAGMAGSLWEWTLDIYEREYIRPCVDCANLNGHGGNRVIRGGSFRSDPARMHASFRYSDTPSDRFGGEIGVRCARAP